MSHIATLQINLQCFNASRKTFCWLSMKELKFEFRSSELLLNPNWFYECRKQLNHAALGNFVRYFSGLKFPNLIFRAKRYQSHSGREERKRGKNRLPIFYSWPSPFTADDTADGTADVGKKMDRHLSCQKCSLPALIIVLALIMCWTMAVLIPTISILDVSVITWSDQLFWTWSIILRF